MQVTNKVYGFAINAETYNNADEMLIDLKTRTITDLRFDDMRSKYLSKLKKEQSYKQSNCNSTETKISGF